MKKVIFFVCLATLAAWAAPERLGTGQIVKTVSLTTVPESIVSTNLWVQRVTILGKKAERTDNTGDIYVGPTSANDAQPYKIATGAEAVITAASGGSFNLKDWYIDVTSAGDGVVVIYQGL